MNLDIKVEGLEGLENALKHLEQISGRHTRGKAAIKRAMRTACQPVADRANATAPDGREWDADKNVRLDESFNVSDKLTRRQKQKHRRDRDRDAVEMFIGTYVSYAHMAEFGTFKMAAQPTLTSAWESMKHQVLNDLVEAMWAEILGAIPKAQKAAARKAAKQ